MFTVVEAGALLPVLTRLSGVIEPEHPHHTRIIKVLMRLVLARTRCQTDWSLLSSSRWDGRQIVWKWLSFRGFYFLLFSVIFPFFVKRSCSEDLTQDHLTTGSVRSFLFALFCVARALRCRGSSCKVALQLGVVKWAKVGNLLMNLKISNASTIESLIKKRKAQNTNLSLEYEL